MIVKQIGVLSAGKMLGALYGILGLLAGGLFTLFAMIGISGSGEGSGQFAFLFGVGAIIIFPLMYGFMGFVGGIISAALYNLLSSVVGGIEIEMS